MDRNVLLEIENLEVHFPTREGTVRALQGVDLSLHRGETVALVGESGCGKSVTARAILQIVPPPGRIVEGRIRLHRQGNGDAGPVELTGLAPGGDEIRGIRGKDIAMIFQEPMTSLSPVHTIGNQIIEAIRLHQGLDGKAARRRAAELLDLVGIPGAARQLDTYPFQFSGGMRQRAMIAMALSCDPSLLIADEPTTALDVTIQAQILELLQRLQVELGMTTLIITHNLGVVAALADRVAVMYRGQIVEEADKTRIFDEPRHPYTQGLLKSIPKVGQQSRTRLYAIAGGVPDPYVHIPGCAFHPRCPEFMPGICDQQDPEMVALPDQHRVRCLLYPDRKQASPGAGRASGEGVNP